MKNKVCKGILIGVLACSLLCSCAGNSGSSVEETTAMTTISENPDVGIAGFTVSEILDSALINGEELGFEIPCLYSELPTSIHSEPPIGTPKKLDIEGYVSSLSPVYSQDGKERVTLGITHREDETYTSGTVTGLLFYEDGLSFTSGEVSLVLGKTTMSDIKSYLGTSGTYEISIAIQYQCSDGTASFFFNQNDDALHGKIFQKKGE